MDPLSVAASIVSLTVPAIQAANRLISDVKNISDAPQTVRNLIEDVSSVEIAIKLLEGIEDCEWDALGPSIVEQSKVAIKNCTSACNSFQANLRHWTRHSQDGRLTFQDKVNVGFFKQHQLRAMTEILQSCKATFSQAVGVATLYSSVRHTHITEEVRRTIVIRETEVANALDLTNARLVEVGKVLGEIRLRVPVEETTEDESDVAIRQVEKERAALECSRKLLEELLKKVREGAVSEVANESQRKTIKITMGNNNSGFQNGIINGGTFTLTFGAPST